MVQLNEVFNARVTRNLKSLNQCLSYAWVLRNQRWDFKGPNFVLFWIDRKILDTQKLVIFIEHSPFFHVVNFSLFSPLFLHVCLSIILFCQRLPSASHLSSNNVFYCKKTLMGSGKMLNKQPFYEKMPSREGDSSRLPLFLT